MTPRAIRQAKKRAESRLLRRSGVIGVDIGYKIKEGRKTRSLAIRVLVREKKNVPPGEMIPKQVGGFPTDVIERGEYKPQADLARYNPLLGGCSIGLCRLTSSGTMGCLVIDDETGDVMGLTNWHVIVADEDSATGDTIAQPAIGDFGTCPADVIGTLARSSLGGKVDCAVLRLDTARSVSHAILNIGAVTRHSTVNIGDSVRKRGRTTGLTYGIVESTDLTLIVNYGPGIGSITFTDQIGIAPVSGIFGTTGDSGSVVVDAFDNAVGLHFAGTTSGHVAANPIMDVLEELAVHLTGEGAGINVTWPDSIPVPMIERSHTINPRHLITGMETNRKRVRRQHDEVIEILDVTWNFTRDEYDAFRTFFIEEIEQGQDYFRLTTIELSATPGTHAEVERIVAFLDGTYQFSRSDNLFSVSAQLEVNSETVDDVADPDLPLPVTARLSWIPTTLKAGEPDGMLVAFAQPDASVLAARAYASWRASSEYELVGERESFPAKGQLKTWWAIGADHWTLRVESESALDYQRLLDLSADTTQWYAVIGRRDYKSYGTDKDVHRELSPWLSRALFGRFEVVSDTIIDIEFEGAAFSTPDLLLETSSDDALYPTLHVYFGVLADFLYSGFSFIQFERTGANDAGDTDRKVYVKVTTEDARGTSELTDVSSTNFDRNNFAMCPAGTLSREWGALILTAYQLLDEQGGLQELGLDAPDYDLIEDLDIALGAIIDGTATADQILLASHIDAVLGQMSSTDQTFYNE